MAFEGNPYDGHTLLPQLEQVEELLGRLPKTARVDRSYKWKDEILVIKIQIPGSGKGHTNYQKTKDRARFRRRASIEPMIGHLKSDYRMIRNCIKGTEGGMINTIMAATAFNMMKKLRKIRESILFVLNQLIRYWSGIRLTPVRY